jgi:hypothetical protein
LNDVVIWIWKMALFGAKWRFSGTVQAAVPVHSVAEVDDGKAFVSAFAPR